MPFPNASDLNVANVANIANHANHAEQTTSLVSATSVVFRLQWKSRHFCNLISATLLRDYFIDRVLPARHSTQEFRFFGRQSVFYDIVNILPSVTAAHLVHVCTSSTQAFLIPPIAPSLSPPKLVSIPPAALSDGADFAPLLHIALHGDPTLQRHQLLFPKVFLLHSPSGSGKTSAASHFAQIEHAALIRVQPMHILPHAVSTSALSTILNYYLDCAISASPSVLLLDDLHFIFPPDDHESSAVFPHLVDRFRQQSSHVALVVCASSVHEVHPAVTSVVDSALRLCMSPSGPFALDLSVAHSMCTRETLARRLRTAGRFHNLAQLVLWARRQVPLLTEFSALGLQNHCMRERISDAPRTQKPTREDLMERWDALSDELAGVAPALVVLKRALLWPLVRGAALRRLGVRTVRGVLLYGLPGTGKTALVRASARACGYGILSVDSATIAHGEVGASEDRLLAEFRKAALQTPCVLFFDEVDSLFGIRAGAAASRLVSCFAQCLDRGIDGLVVLAATNRPWVVASGLLQPGRFDYLALVDLPDAGGRVEIAHVYARKLGLRAGVRECFLKLVADGRAGRFSGADIAGLCRRAVMSALWFGREVCEGDFEDAFRGMSPSVSEDDARLIANWRAKGNLHVDVDVNT